MSFLLTIAEGREAGRELLFERAKIAVGRTAQCDLVVNHSGVSRNHARIFREGTRYWVEDCGSSNGTCVNGRRVSRQPLSQGDVVAFGPAVFTFRVGGADGTELDWLAEQHTRILPPAAPRMPPPPTEEPAAPSAAKRAPLRRPLTRLLWASATSFAVTALALALYFAQ